MAERVGNGADRGAFHDGQRVVREPRRALRERPEHGRATSRELVTNTAACNDHRSLGAAEQDGPFRRSRSPLHAVMAPVFRLALVPAATADQRNAAHVVERQRVEKLRHETRVHGVLEARAQLDQCRLAEGRADEADADRQTEAIPHRNVDDRIADDGGDS